MKKYITTFPILYPQRFLKENLKIKGNLKIFLISNLFLGWLFFFLYLFQVGIYTQEVYLQTKNQKEIFQLSKENELLAIELAKSNSLSNVEEYFKKGSFVKIKPLEIKYIRILNKSLATNEQ